MIHVFDQPFTGTYNESTNKVSLTRIIGNRVYTVDKVVDEPIEVLRLLAVNDDMFKFAANISKELKESKNG